MRCPHGTKVEFDCHYCRREAIVLMELLTASIEEKVKETIQVELEIEELERLYRK